MKVLNQDTKFGKLGKPGAYFSPGFARRLQLVAEQVELEGKKILDLGCGKGVWLEQFLQYTVPEHIFGTDIDPELIGKIVSAQIPKQNLQVCPAEDLHFDDDTFDIVFSNEVLEHVEDDAKTMQEVLRVLKPGGVFVFFTPNRGWPFEQHGIYVGDRYIWGNIPFLPWLPKFFHKKFARHVRNYWDKDIRGLVPTEKGEIIFHSYVYPGFDGLVRKFGFMGRIIQRFFHSLEKTPFKRFGISHFVIVRKVG